MPRRIPFFMLDSFTDTPFAGNPAGVFFDDAGVLSDEEMQQMAGEVSLESAFVSPPTEADANFRLRYFTGACEVPLCGHDTVAATIALHHTRRIVVGAAITFQTSIGPLPVSLGLRDDGALSVTLFQTPREFGRAFDAANNIARIADALGCGPGDILITASFSPRRVSTGTPWILVPVASRAVVNAAPADLRAITRLSLATDTFGMYVFVYDVDDETGKKEVWSRCFAPVAGLDEDPVTGSGAGALGFYLHRAGLLTQGDTLTIRQGFGGKRERGGVATVGTVANPADDDAPTVTVSGGAILVAEGAFVLP